MITITRVLSIKLFLRNDKHKYEYMCICLRIHVSVYILCFLTCTFLLLMPRISKPDHAVVCDRVCHFLPEAAQITGKKACERMKEVLRRGVDRQVAEGMFERAQERMQHQCQQLKVFLTTF